jgi:hypothetical protein
MSSATIRSSLVDALRDDLLGPDVDDPRDAAHQAEVLPISPSRWYLAGLLAPVGLPAEDKSDDESEDEIDSLDGSAADGESEPSAPPRKPIFPSSLGLSVLLAPGVKEVTARVSFGRYIPSDKGPGAWARTPHVFTLPLVLDPKKPRIRVAVGDEGVVLTGMLRPLPEGELELVPKGTLFLTLFLVNEIQAVPAKGEGDRNFLFQAQLQVTCPTPFVARPNRRGARDDDDLDEQVGDLLYRDAFDYCTGHGVSGRWTLDADGQCRSVSSCWMPTAEVEKVAPSSVPGLVLDMAKLAEVADGAALQAAVGGLVPAYRKWIAAQGETPLDTEGRKRTAKTLLARANIACDRIARGLDVLAKDPLALEAFRLANKTMATSQWQRSGDQLRRDGRVPSWRPFQLAFLLMNLAGIVDPLDGERDAVDLIFFPTGGGKTEAYLGLAAFTLVLRRLRNPTLGSGGMTVLMRYTLRLLTMDQLERAATLICALELERRKAPTKLGPQRFSIGLWVGQSATPNRFGSKSDKDDKTARAKTLAYAKDPKSNPAPVPMDKCPWCGAIFDQDTFALKPGSDAPTKLRMYCNEAKCPFRPTSAQPDGIPVVAVDEEIYREMPCFLIATVDKFASLPWVGETGLLLGRDVTHHDADGFYGPASKPKTAKPLTKPLLPPELIIQDELHLISGPLGTLVGLYETAIDYLASRKEGDKWIRPKIVASTATVRRAAPQIRALFGRTRVEIFPPPGPNRRDSFFAETVPASKASPRLYVGLVGPGRSQKVTLMRSYIALLAAAQKAAETDKAGADPYLTLLGYFNSLRELGGSRRIVEDEVRSRLLRAGTRHRVGSPAGKLANRTIAMECVEITSRESTDKVKVAKERLGQDFLSKPKKGRAAVDVALASNMISVGLDIQRLGLMVVCGQPRTTAEYIQSSSRVGRDDQRPGLVVTLLNVYKPRDRSHFEHFTSYHESFYRGVEATSVTPFSSRAIDRGLAGVVVALARLGDARLTAADSAGAMPDVSADLGFIADVLAARGEAHREGNDDHEPVSELQLDLRQRVSSLLDSWQRIAKDDPGSEGLAYQRFEDQTSKRPLLRMPMDADLHERDDHERRFVANRSMRDVEQSTDLQVTSLRLGAASTAPKETP